MTVTDLDDAILDPVVLAPDVPELAPERVPTGDPGVERDEGPLRSVSIAMNVLGCFETEPELGAPPGGPVAGGCPGPRAPATGWACGCSRWASWWSTG